MTNPSHTELAARARVFAYDIQAHHISDALADKISELLNECAAALESPERVLGEACPICFADEPYTGTCGSNDPRALCKRASAPPTAPAQDAQGVIGWLEQTADGRKRVRLNDPEMVYDQDATWGFSRTPLAALRASSPADTREPLTDGQWGELVLTVGVDPEFDDPVLIGKIVRVVERAHGIGHQGEHMSEQSEALELAARLETRVPSKTCVLDLTSAAELRRQHSRIEADEALMRTAAEALEHVQSWFTEEQSGYADCAAAITAMRKRLESSK